MRKGVFALLIAAVLMAAASPQSNAQAASYKTHNVIVAVMDGVRYSETFGDKNRALIPNLAAMEKEGTLFTNVRIAGPGVSVTRQGHSTIASGTWQTIALAGARMTRPSFFEYARNELGWKESDCWAIFGKGMYSFASYSSFPTYGRDYKPSFVNSIGEKEIGNDDLVLERLFKTMDQDKPKLVFVNFGVTDHIAHVSSFEQYQEAIRRCDQVFGKLWQKVQSTPGYKDETTVFFTNDHGRHDSKTNMPQNGFSGHGDQCNGCRHIMMLTVGPDVKRDAVVEKEVQQIDICPTVGELLGFQTPLSNGKVVTDFLVSPLNLNKKEAKTAAARDAGNLLELSKRDLVKTIADANLKRDAASLTPSAGTEVLLRGMLLASDVTKEPAYQNYVKAWVEKNQASIADNPHTARIAMELLVRDPKAGAWSDDIKACAGKCASNLQTTGTDALMAAAFTADSTSMFKDAGYDATIKKAFGLAGKTEDQLVKAWRALKVNNTQMACDVPKPVSASASMDDALKLMALEDAASATPTDRILRLACTLQMSVCSQGRPELGVNWPDPVQSALTLASVMDVNTLKPKITWVEAPGPKAKQKRGTRWAFPMQFYKDSIPWQLEQLRYQVNADGHFAKGDPMSDGAAIIAFATARGKSLAGGKIVTQMD